MRLKMMLIRLLIVYILTLNNVLSICPNNCSGHGKCENSVCVCYSDSASGENYVGSDCSLRGCGLGNPFSAVGSVYGSSSKVYGIAPSRRELSSVTEMNIAKREVSKEFTLGLEKDGKALDADATGAGKLWQVSGIDDLVQPFGASGGILSCKFTKDSDNVEEKPLNVISRTSTSIYVLFDEEVTTIGKSGDTYESVICSDILSMRNDLTQFNPTIKPVTTPPAGGRLLSNNNSTRRLQDPAPDPPVTEPPTLSFTWDGFLPILKDMGLLKPKTVVEGGEEVYEELTFACYEDITPSPPRELREVRSLENEILGVEMKTYKTNKVGIESGEGKENNVQFTITDSDFDSSKKYVCILAMNEDGSVLKIEESDISEYIRKEKDVDGKDIYLIGKYGNSADAAKIDNVIVGSVTTVDGKDITLTPPTDEDDKLNFEKNRIVYGTVLENGIFKEVEVKIKTVTDTITGESQHTGGLLLPYIRLSSVSPLTSPPKQLIADKTGDELFYKAYYFAEDLLKSMKREGGILNCKYTTTRERMLAEEQVDVDVRGIIKDSKGVIIYSYLDMTNVASFTPSSGTLECESIKSIRNDMTKYHELSPLTLEYVASDGGGGGGDVGGRRELQDPKNNIITWSGYGEILKNMGYTDQQKVKFGCFKTDDNTKEIKSFAGEVSYENENVKFTFTPPEDDSDTKYLCFMMTRYNKNEVVLEESDIKDRIVYDEKSPKNYYYGEYMITETTRYLEEGESEVIILSSGSKITLPESDPSTTLSTITISDYDKLDANTKKLIDELKEFSLKMLQISPSYQEITVKCTVKTSEPVNPRILQESTPKELSFTFTPEDGFNKEDIPFYVMYLKMPQTPSPNPSEIPTYTPTNVIKNIDINSYFYEVTNFLNDIKDSLPLIGGTIECKIDEENNIGLIDIRGVFDDKIYIKLENPLSARRRVLSDEISLENIRDCRILSIRKDMSLYNVLKLDGSNYVNGIISWIGYGEIFKSLKGNVVCYTPSETSSEEMKIYSNIEIYRMKNNNNNGFNDLRIRFGKDNKPSIDDICYMLSDSNGVSAISIKESELNEMVRTDGVKYYFGKYEIDEKSGVSEEKKKSDGSVEISFNSKKCLNGYTNENERFDKTNEKKVDLFDINNPSSPSLYVPTDMIGLESEKMIIIGNTVELTIIDRRTSKDSIGEGQILKIEKDILGRYKISLSKPIYLLPKLDTRLRSLQQQNEISTDLLIVLNWKSEGSTHVALECSGQGICDRESGLCKCFGGYSGSYCQRLDCPNNCNGNGRCVALSELLSNDELDKYIGFGNKHVGDYKPDDNANKKVQFDNQVYGCLCDKRHRGYDCSLIECPSGEDPEEATNMDGEDDEKRDCSGRGICNYSTGICECFDGFNGEGCQNPVQTM